MHMAVLLAVLLSWAVACSPAGWNPQSSAPPGSADNPARELPRSVRAVLEQADSFEILALAPSGVGGDMTDATALFHSWRVLGRSEVSSPEDRKRLLALIEQGLTQGDGRAAKCFNPRHAITAKRGAEIVDVVVCYECFQIEVHGPRHGERAVVLTGSHVLADVDAFYRLKGLQPAASR